MNLKGRRAARLHNSAWWGCILYLTLVGVFKQPRKELQHLIGLGIPLPFEVVSRSFPGILNLGLVEIPRGSPVDRTQGTMNLDGKSLCTLFSLTFN